MSQRFTCTGAEYEEYEERKELLMISAISPLLMAWVCMFANGTDSLLFMNKNVLFFFSKEIECSAMAKSAT